MDRLTDSLEGRFIDSHSSGHPMSMMASSSSSLEASSSSKPVTEVRRQGTRVEVFESKAKRGTGTNNASKGPSIYINPLPLYVSNNDTLSLLWSITWTLSLSCQILTAHLRPRINSRNKVDSSTAYLTEKIQGIWDERTKSVWILPSTTTPTRTRKKKKRSDRDKADKNSNGVQPIPNIRDSRNSITSSSSADEAEEITEEVQKPWMQQLWRKGFFGKGSLSRSEPTWWQREKNRITGEHVPTAEDITKARRVERMVVKKQKAQERADEKEKQALALAQRKKQQEVEQDLGGDSDSPVVAAETHTAGGRTTTSEDQIIDSVPSTIASTGANGITSISSSSNTERPNQSDPSPSTSSSLSLIPPTNTESETALSPTSSLPPTMIPGRGAPKTRLPNAEIATLKQEAKIKEMSINIRNLEYTQLQREEVFFLALCSGSIEVFVRNPSSSSSTSHTSSSSSSSSISKQNEQATKPLTLFELWELFTKTSLITNNTFINLTELEKQSIRIKPDNPFIISYLVYHHYRSLGWVVRNGIKFCVDWVIYKGSDGVENMRGGAGPVGGHAEFAIAVIPTYEDPSDASTSSQLNFRRDWRWLNTVNRVCSGVKKTVILTYVTIPKMSNFNNKFDKNGNFIDFQDPGCLKYYNIKEVSVRRFIPTRMRD